MSDWVVFDLGFGDAGKGTITDYLVRSEEIGLVVRWHGGAQAGHNVVTPDGRHHTFSQFPAGTLAGALGLLGRDFLLHPGGLIKEAEHLVELGIRAPFQHLRVHAEARLITPYQQAANQLREVLRGDSAHGTCGVGVGECVADSLREPEHTLRASDLGDAPRLRRVLARQRTAKRAELVALGATAAQLEVFDAPELVERVIEVFGALAPWLELVDGPGARRLLEQSPSVLFEGAQGVLLDETWGFHPHTTWSDCTPAGALAMAPRPLTRLGVLRSYATRHGAGPFPTAGTVHLPEPHNTVDGWQGDFRTGALDLVLVRYALEVCGGVDQLAITHIDRLHSGPLCTHYEELGQLVPGDAGDLAHRRALGQRLLEVTPVLEQADIPERLAELAPVTVHSSGPTATDKTRLPPAA